MDLDTYLATIPDERIKRFNELRALIKALYPQARETMRYKMPTYEYQNAWLALANQKHYISLYTCNAEHLVAFKQTHPRIKTGKGCINFRDQDEIPVESLSQVITNAMEFQH